MLEGGPPLPHGNQRLSVCCFAGQLLREQCAVGPEAVVVGQGALSSQAAGLNGCCWCLCRLFHMGTGTQGLLRVCK